jgi:predicted nuclease with RNAse H fold
MVETYPGMTQDVLGIPRKRLGVDGLRRGLKRQGIRGVPRRRLTHDELDAITCALTGLLHLEGRTETLGSGVPVPLVLPDRAMAWQAPRGDPPRSRRYNPAMHSASPHRARPRGA